MTVLSEHFRREAQPSCRAASFNLHCPRLFSSSWLAVLLGALCKLSYYMLRGGCGWIPVAVSIDNNSSGIPVQKPQ